MNFREKLQSVLQKLGLQDKAKAGSLTKEEWSQIVASYHREYQITIQDDMAAEESAIPNLSAEQLAQVQKILSTIVAPDQTTHQTDNPEPAPVSGAELVALAQSVRDLVTSFENRAKEDLPTTALLDKTIAYTGPGNRAHFLFGIEDPMFSMSNRWNKIAANTAVAASMSTPNEEESTAFHRQIVAYSRSLQERYNYLHSNGMLDANRLAKGEFGTNFNESEAVGKQYLTLRQDALIARVLQKRDLTQFFPVRYGIQDRDLVFNAFFNEISQGYQTGEIWKGGMKLEHEMGHVDDAMIKIKFGPMKELERQYIGYLNREGSDPIKWSMIEFCVLNTLESAQVEQNKRRMRGIYIKPEEGVPGNSLNASTGVLYTLLRYHHENKILLHDDESYRSYSDADMLNAVQEFVSDVYASCTEDMDLDNHVLYLNKMHQPWWIKNVRAKYGKDIDFSGPTGYLHIVPDTNLRIQWLPYLGQLPLMFMDIPGNIQFLEFIPGEMLAIRLKEDMEMVKAWSTWKEGCAASFTGRRFSTPAGLKENAYEWQQIFMNKPSISLDADATTADARKGFWFLTSANTGAKSITNIDGAKPGVAYIIECASTEHATTIQKSDKFAAITETFTPTAVGDYIMVILNSKGNFLEIERTVGGVRKINTDLQPNIPGAR